MRENRGILAICVIGIIVVSFTFAAFFLLDIERTNLNIWALAFLVLSEVVLFGGLIGIRIAGASHNILFLRLGISSTLFIYFAATLISVLLAGVFGDRVNAFILLQLAIVALAAITVVAILAFSKSTQRRNEIDAKKVGTNEPKRGGF